MAQPRVTLPALPANASPQQIAEHWNKQRGQLERAANALVGSMPARLQRDHTTGENHLLSVGPFTIPLGVTLTVSDGTTWYVL